MAPFIVGCGASDGAALEAFQEAALEVQGKQERCQTFDLEQRVWRLTQDHATFQTEIESLKSEDTALNDRRHAASLAVNGVDPDPVALREQAEVLLDLARNDAAAYASKCADFEKRLKHAEEHPVLSLTMAQFAKVGPSRLQRIVGAHGWSRENEGVMSFTSSGYESSSFRAAKGDQELRVMVVRPVADASGEGMASARATADAEGGRYDTACDCAVVVRPEDADADDATREAARALLAAIVAE